MNRKFLQALAERPLLFDGAMGSLLYDRGVFLTHSYDELNLSRPELVEQVHREYVVAGADILETNTFSANRMALAKHGFGEKVRDINLAAVKLARAAAHGKDVFVAGAVGPSGIAYTLASKSQQKLAEESFREQLQALISAEVDLIVFETFASLSEMEAAISIVKELDASLPIVAQMLFDAKGSVERELSAEQVAERLLEAGADVIGANCGLGPPELYAIGARLAESGKPVSIQPNAGLPSVVDGRTIYVANPELFGVFARRMLKSGIRLVGGCCGTTPDYTRTMLGAVRMMGGAPTSVRVSSNTNPPPFREAVTALSERSQLSKRLAAGEFLVSVELSAPAGTEPGEVLSKIAQLRAAGIDTVNIADGPRATARMSNLAFCTRIKQETGAEPILHVCARDRNYLGLIAHLLGAHTLGIRNLVIITGDPPKMGDYPFATPVYDVDSIGLLEMASTLNAGFEPSGNKLQGHTSFLLATGAEPGAHDRDRELLRLEKKKAAGAELVMTQPVYDPQTLFTFLEEAKPLGLPVMVGLLPLASHRNAEFLHNEVPGMQIPLVYRERMAKAGSGPAARQVGVSIAQEALSAVADKVAGAYIMPPFNRIESALSILEVVAPRMNETFRRTLTKS